MPSSGARSGTQPNRPERGAGDGSISTGVKLKCGHRTEDEPVTVFPGGKKMWRCPEGCGLQTRSWRQRD